MRVGDSSERGYTLPANTILKKHGILNSCYSRFSLCIGVRREMWLTLNYGDYMQRSSLLTEEVTAAASAGTALMPTLLDPMPFLIRTQSTDDGILPKEVTVSLFTQSGDEVLQPKNRRVKVGTAVSRFTIEQYSEIRAAADQVLSPIIAKILRDNPEHSRGRSVRVDITQSHPRDESLRIAAAPYVVPVPYPAEGRALSRMQQNLVDYIVSTASRSLDPGL